MWDGSYSTHPPQTGQTADHPQLPSTPDNATDRLKSVFSRRTP